MKQENIANIILSGMSKQVAAGEITFNKTLINEVVEGWNRNIYVIPPQSLRLHKPQPPKYTVM